MALIAIATNLSDLREHSDYAIEIRINDRVIFSGVVIDHQRSLGAAVLLRRMADEMEAEPNSRNAA